MIKEEILRKHVGDAYITHIDDILQAMSEYAEQEMKSILNYSSDNYEKSLKPDTWIQHGEFIGVSTDELINAYKQQQNATTK